MRRSLARTTFCIGFAFAAPTWAQESVDAEQPKPEEPAPANPALSSAAAPRASAPANAELLARVERLERLEAERKLQPVSPAQPVSKAPMLQPSLLGELDYRVFPSELEGNTGFALARLRPGLALTPASWVRAVTSFEFAGESPIILDAFAKLRAAEWVEFTAGYSKPPLFASFVYEPVHTTPFPDRAPVVSAFRVRRDLGADVHFTPRSVPLEGWVRVGNGTGSALGNDNALPAGYAALDLVLGRAWAGSASENRTYGLRVGVAALVESPRDRGGISGQTPLGFVYYRPLVVSGLRVVGEAHVVGYAGPLRLTVEGAMAHEQRSRDDDGNPSTPRVDLPAVRSYGVTAEVAYVVLGRARQVGHAPSSRGGQGGRWDGGALEVAARFDELWLGEGAADVRSGGSTGGALALKWWPTDFLAASLAGYTLHYDTPPLEDPSEFRSWGALARLSFFWGLPGQPGQPGQSGQSGPAIPHER